MSETKYKAKAKLIRAALDLVQADLYMTEHPADPTGDWNSEYKEDMMLEAAQEYVEACSRSGPGT